MPSDISVVPLYVVDHTRKAHCHFGARNYVRKPARKFWFYSRRRSMLMLLTTAHDLIRDPRDWTTGSCYDHVGRLCGLGALQVAAYRTGITHSGTVFKAVCRHLEGLMEMPIPSFNDEHTHAEVMQVFDQAEGNLRSVFYAL